MRKLNKNPSQYKMFREVVDMMIEEGIWKEVDPTYPKRYTPLIAVVDMQKGIFQNESMPRCSEKF